MLAGPGASCQLERCGATSQSQPRVTVQGTGGRCLPWRPHERSPARERRGEARTAGGSSVGAGWASEPRRAGRSCSSCDWRAVAAPTRGGPPADCEARVHGAFRRGAIRAQRLGAQSGDGDSIAKDMLLGPGSEAGGPKATKSAAAARRSGRAVTASERAQRLRAPRPKLVCFASSRTQGRSVFAPPARLLRPSTSAAGAPRRCTPSGMRSRRKGSDQGTPGQHARTQQACLARRLYRRGLVTRDASLLLPPAS